MARYNNYHRHSHTSNLFGGVDSNTKPEEYIKKCVEYGHTNYFTTEHGSFGDIFEARTLCNKYGLRCIAGIEGYIVPDPLQKDKSNYHIIIIPTTDNARKKMNYISTHANVEGFYYKPRLFPSDLLSLGANDVYITTACVAGLLSDETSVKQLFIPLMKHFGDHMLLEVQAHNVDKQKDVVKRALKLQSKFGLKLIAANDSHYIDEQGKLERLELMRGKHITYGEEDDFVLDFPTAETMFDRFQKQGILSEQQIEDAINNTLIFDECEEIQLNDDIKMPTIYPDLTPEERLNELKRIVIDRFKIICKDEHITGEELKKYKDGIRYEMDILEKTNDVVHTADYFLFNTKNIELAVNKYGGVLTRGGRGSCASFYINRILGITQLDRFKINLPIFPDRFMSVARCVENRSMPDDDLNVREQEPFVAASRELLGEHGCYPMYAPGTMQLSEAFRNVCRSKNLPYDSYNEIAKDVESHMDDAEWKDIIEEANRYVGTIVSGSVHPCAFALDNKDLRYEYGLSRFGDNLCVLVTSSEADEYKILKNDYLIVSVWKLISDTFDLVGKPIIPARQLLDEIKDDQRIWDLFKNGITCTLNQVDSDNGTRQAKQFGIKSFEEGALITAAIRPSFDAWREQFLNHEPYSTGSEQLDEVLEQTGHYILYQESLMQYFEWLGVTPAESIGLIKKISKKKIKPDDFAKLEERIKKNWIEKTGSDQMFKETWEMIQGCMAYGFCSAHAAATSLDMCYGAYLKVHHTLEYYTVCFNHYAGDEVRTNKLTKELEYFGLKLKGVKFGFSGADYTFDKEQKVIYKGISSIKFVSHQLGEELYSLKDNHYDSFIDILIDLKEKTSCNSRQLEILIGSNFFEEYGGIHELLQQVVLFNSLYTKKQLKKEKVEELNLPIYILEKHCGKITEKIYKDFDSVGLLKDIVAHTEFPHTSIYAQLMYQNDLLGYPVSTLPKLAGDIYFVCDIVGSYKNQVVIYRICDGSMQTIKFSKAKGLVPLERNQVIRINEFALRFRKKKVGEDAKGKAIFEETDQQERIISKYVVCNT